MKRILILLSFIGALVSCKTYQPVNGTAIDDMNVAFNQSLRANQQLAQKKSPPPARITSALLPDYNARSAHRYRVAERRFDLSVKDVPATTFFMGLVKGTSLSMAVSPEVKGNITLSLKNVTVREVLQTLEDLYGYSYRMTHSGYQILPNKLKTMMYAVNYLDIERQGRSNMQISSGQVSQSGGVNRISQNNGAGTMTSTSNNRQISSSIGDVETKNNIDFWRQLKQTLLSMIGTEGGRTITVNPMAGMVIVKAYPAELKQVERYLDAVQHTMDREVILEAKILEVALSDRYQMGIDWKLFGAHLNAINDFPASNISQQAFPDAFNIDFSWNKNFSTTIRALSEQGNVQVLSSPRVSAINNQKAVIKVGSDEFYVTNVSSANTQTLNSVTPTQNVQLTPFFSGITLDVTPQIDAQGNIILHIHPSVSRVVDQQKQISLGNNGQLVLPLARSTIRESDTVVHARDGQVIVIGGLMENRTQEDLAGLPFFANIPFLGTLLRHTKQGSQKSELVILMRPIVVKRHVWSASINQAKQQINSLKRGFHFGGHPDVFGNEGERPQQLGAVSGRYGNAMLRGAH